MNFDYYYGDESNQFAFYRIPRQLITGEAFKKLSTDAKLLYGLLLDRMGLSAKNGWYDDMGRVFIYYTLDEIQEDLDCGHMEYVFDCLRRNTTQVRNIRAYLLTALYNAPVTINNYYQAAVQHDFSYPQRE